MRIDPDLLNLLDRCTTAGQSLTLPDQLDRKTYERINKVLEAAGGKWNRKAKAHVFDAEASERVSQMIETGAVDLPKDEFNFFPTPAGLVARLLDLAGVRPGDQVLEPSAGRGAIALEAAARGAFVDCVELMPMNVQHLAGESALRTLIHSDFLAVEPGPFYSHVVMNPPFAKQADIRHVMHARKFLRRGGSLTAIMSASVEFRSNRLTEEFRDMVANSGGTVEALPDESFKASGTMVRTVLVHLPGRI